MLTKYALLTKLHELRTSLEIVQKQKPKNKSSWEHAANDYARLSCVQLCQHMYTKVPPELRTQIYAHLMGPGGTEHINGLRAAAQDTQHAAPHIDLAASICALPTSTSIPPSGARTSTSVSRNRDNVDREIAAHWYRIQRFVFSNAQDRTQFKKFLTSDIFGKKLVPGNVVQHIEIHVSESDVISPDARDRLSKQLVELERMGNKNVQLVLRVPADHPVMERPFRDAVAGLKGVVGRLRGMGFSGVQVRERGRLDGRGEG
ncbi:hypothetical protein CC86DRAFT_468824 [Ophiobolus disseminans]|uniref:Uncharacterized protein n=1 Tax=Ophiobolus disseminans TaxID=1469910 RepID=A0A6A6ZU16_9PLEO|nr:hypothetical protein CC86DRAFT_468824 [Ophiobolus disseminans]